ncbi:down syndrome cell adhesion molecule [Trichonephila clavata]|uniref:Down syndrome cell adhesion molecule n=1 Tax=Trichonephila clavata TaxID=2740835 RepID=A0A8X6IXW5_TRICU|nr:down syndrome cell adhesion molecule [Trichonephila clavata]
MRGRQKDRTHINVNDKYTVLASGELILHRVDDSDGKRNFKCRARHKLTGELVLSPTTGKVIVTEPHSPMGPRITFSQSQVRAEEGSYVRIPCVSTAQPAPDYRLVIIIDNYTY